MVDHRKRFARWRRMLPKNTSYLVEQVLARVETVLGLLSELFDIFDRGIPEDWRNAGRGQKVTKHLMLVNSQQLA